MILKLFSKGQFFSSEKRAGDLNWFHVYRKIVWFWWLWYHLISDDILLRIKYC